jgi:hypothetical protein
MPSFGVAIVLLGGLQGLTVALPGAGWPAWLWHPSGRGWALVAPGSILVVIAAISLLPGVADGLTWLALIAVPPLAAAALGWAMRRARPTYALAVVPIFALAWGLEGHLSGDAAALILTALSCVTLGRLVAGLAPALLIKAGLIVAAIVDTTLIVTEKLQGPNNVLSAAAPAAHLPKLQLVTFSPAQMGYGDLFVAGLLGAVLAIERRSSVAAALLTFAFASLMDLLFLVTDTLPATVPVALALIAVELCRKRHWGQTLLSHGGRRGPLASRERGRARSRE